MSDSTSTPAKVDGRRLRSDRSRQVIVEAMLQLINEGNLVPTAQQIANHAKVGIRSVFRHFEDMEAIFATADQIWREGFTGKSTTASDVCLPSQAMHAFQAKRRIYPCMNAANKNDSEISKMQSDRNISNPPW